MEQQEYMFSIDRKIEGENEREREGGRVSGPSLFPYVD